MTDNHLVAFRLIINYVINSVLSHILVIIYGVRYSFNSTVSKSDFWLVVIVSSRFLEPEWQLQMRTSLELRVIEYERVVVTLALSFLFIR